MAVPVVEATQIFNQTSNATTTGAITLSLGTISENDIILVCSALDGAPSAFAVSGNNSGSFIAFGNRGQGSVELDYAWVRQGATVDTTVTISWTGSEQGRFMIIRISGAREGEDILDITGAGTSNADTTTSNVDALNSTEINTLAICAVAVDRDRVDGADGFSDAQGFTEVGTSGSSGGANGAGLIVGEKDLPFAGGSLSPTFGTWVSDGNANRMFNIKGPPIPALAPMNINVDCVI